MPWSLTILLLDPASTLQEHMPGEGGVGIRPMALEEKSLLTLGAGVGGPQGCRLNSQKNSEFLTHGH